MNQAVSKVMIAGVLLVGLATGSWLYARYGEIKQAAIEKSKRDTAAYLQKRAYEFLTAEDFIDRTAGRGETKFQAYFDAVQAGDVLRMKVWNRNFTVVWSDLHGIIGQRFPDNHEVKEALEGHVEFELEKLKFEHVSERAFVDVSETYVPFRNDKGEVVGVFEVYRPAAPLFEEIYSQFQNIAITALTLAALAIGMLILAARLFLKGGKPFEART